MSGQRIICHHPDLSEAHVEAIARAVRDRGFDVEMRPDKACPFGSIYVIDLDAVLGFPRGEWSFEWDGAR